MPEKTVQTAMTVEPAKYQTPEGEMLDIIQSKIQALELEQSQTESFFKKHAPVLAVLGFVIVTMFAWYQQVQTQMNQQETRLAVIEQQQGEMRSLNVESRLTKIETTVANFQSQQDKANVRMEGMLERILDREDHGHTP